MKKEPHIPEGLEIGRITWSSDGEKYNTLGLVKITLQNNTDEDFSMVRYRVIVTAEEETIFSKVYFYNQILFSGEVIELTVSELSGFWVGQTINPAETEKRSWDLIVLIEDSQPFVQ